VSKKTAPDNLITEGIRAQYAFDQSFRNELPFTVYGLSSLHRSTMPHTAWVNASRSVGLCTVVGWWALCAQAGKQQYKSKHHAAELLSPVSNLVIFVNI
jgi:hypothetical protein